ncbi:MAG: FtsX-like permease family protein [Vicinamibacterales bacterium]|nr:FtsX-like permease family protein [Vicinamibacterales bacterium]
MRRAFGFAWRSLVRQPARATLGILGVAAVGALLFDMLLLSQGLVISMRDLLERSGFDIRVTATDSLPNGGPMIDNATDAARAIAALPSVSAALTIRFANARIERLAPSAVERLGAAPVRSSLQGVGTSDTHPWTILRGDDLQGGRELLINENAARMLGVTPGTSVTVRASCSEDREALPPVEFRVAGVAAFPFDTPDAATAATSSAALDEACGGQEPDAANVIMVAAKDDPVIAAGDISQLRPDLRAFTNDESVGRLEQGGFTYFRQISTVLTTVTISFALLLITVLLTVSVNQRLGEIAALRALGFTRMRVVSDVLAESILIVGIGGALSLPLGVALAAGLDRILKRMPQIPENLHFFVFEPRALGVHITLLAVTALVAALYPMRIVARLPIAATLRDEVIG